VGAASAQVAITGGIGFAWIKDIQARADGSAAKGLVNSSAYIDVSVTEDLGGGYTAAGFMEFNQDGAFGAKAYGDNKSLSLTTPFGALALANTRSGGNQAAGLVGPTGALWEGAFDVGNVITRAPIDVASVTAPVATGLAMSLKYVEAYQSTITMADYNPSAANTTGAGDGAATPQTTTWVVGGTYTGVPGLKATFNYNISDATPAFKTFLAGLGVTDPRLTSYDLSLVYNASFATLGFSFDSARRAKQTGTDEAAYLLGVSVPVGAAKIGANYAMRDKNSFYQIGGQYDLSKRTNVAAAYGGYTTGGKGLPSGDLSQDTWAVRLNHSF